MAAPVTVVSPSTVMAAMVGPSAGGFDELMSRAEKQREAGNFVESARSYAAAYRALSDEERVGLTGEITVDNALADYRQARQSNPDDIGLVEENLALVDEAVASRAQAHEAGTADAVPGGLLIEQGKLRKLLDQMKAAQPAAEPEPEPAAQEPVEAQPEPEPEPEPEQEPAQPAEPGNKKADIAILSVGIVSLVGGAGLIGGGAWNLSQLDDRVQAQRAALDAGSFTDDVRSNYEAQLTDWESQWRGLSLGLIAGGAVLAAAGVGLTAWGAIRLKKNSGGSDARAAIAFPMASRDRLGLTVRLNF
ncbi:MAG: hypothetical protein AAF799_01010 [Myxococcota bacterium]